MSPPRPRLTAGWLWGILLLVMVLVLGRAAIERSQAHQERAPGARLRRAVETLAAATHQPLPVYGEVPAFALVDQSGAAVTRETFHGHPWIADFVFTRCAGQCPMLTAQLAPLRRRLPETITFVSFSVDPSWDTPERLRAHVEQQALPEPWRFLTGDTDVVYALSREGFHLTVEPDGGSVQEPILHSTRVVLVDGEGQIRGYYDGMDAEALARLERDTLRLESGSAP